MCSVQCVIFVVPHYTLHTIHYRNTVHTNKVNTTQYTLQTNCQKNTRYTKYTNYTVHSTHYRLHSTHLLGRVGSLLHSTRYTVPKLNSTQYTGVSQIPACLSIFWKHKINNFVFTIFSEIFSLSGTFKHEFGQIIPSNGSTHSHLSCFYYLSGNIKTKKLPILNILRPYQRISILSKMLISVTLDTPMALQAHTAVGFIFSEV